MSGFSDERLTQWRNFFFEYKEYGRLYRENEQEIREHVRRIPDNRTNKGEGNFGIVLSIKNEKWAIKSANDVRHGALIGFKDQFIIYDFDNSKAITTSYSMINTLNREKSVINIGLDNKQKIALNVNLNAGAEAAKGCLTILLGMSQSNTRSYNPMATREASREYIDDSNKMTEYLDGICNFFIEAVEGKPLDERTF